MLPHSSSSTWISRLVNKRRNSHKPLEEPIEPSEPNPPRQKWKRTGIPHRDLVCDSCVCCGTLIRYPADVFRVRCMVCQTSFDIDKGDKETPEEEVSTAISYALLKETMANCASHPQEGPENTPSSPYKPVEDLVFSAFSSHKTLNASFKVNPDGLPTYYSPNLDLDELRRFYGLLRSLPSNRPFYVLLTGALNLLRHPPPITDFTSINWMLVLLEIPLLQESLVTGTETQPSSLSPQLKAICYNILKHLIGLMAHMDKKCRQYVTHWWSLVSHADFIHKIDFLNLYITFQLTRCINYEIYNAVINPQVYLSSAQHAAAGNDDVNYKEALRAHFIRPTSESSDFGLPISIPLFISSGGRRLFSSSQHHRSSPSMYWTSNETKEHNIKIKLQQYSDEWHLRTAARVLSLLFYANKSRDKVPGATFYNSLVDYVNVKQDFDSWQFSIVTKEHEQAVAKREGDPAVLVLDYLKAESRGTYLNVTSDNGASLRRPSFTFCQFPFLISLGAKITILEHEAKHSMQTRAEEAFIQSINKKTPFDMYFKVRVRRDHITNDSLRSIKAHRNDLKKLLKVEFVDEPGIDAGGLKKEWFLLLTKELFDANRGLFSYNEESQLCYFALSPIDGDELYYLVGAVLGLAIYNSTILDLKLPRALYKKLMGLKVSLADFSQLNPQAGASLNRMLRTNGVQDWGIYFEVTYKDILDRTITRELIKGGGEVLVTDENKYEYVERYLNFFLSDVCKRAFDAFKSGFLNVVGGNALSLFTPEEIQLILIGDASGNRIDTSTMKSVTKYKGFSEDDTTIGWFWNYFDRLNTPSQKKLLFFVTGTDRLPATGLPSLHFKITRLQDGQGPSARLPISHTCFNELCLYDYQSQELFDSKMSMALDYCEGFGLK